MRGRASRCRRSEGDGGCPSCHGFQETVLTSTSRTETPPAMVAVGGGEEGRRVVVVVVDGGWKLRSSRLEIGNLERVEISKKLDVGLSELS